MISLLAYERSTIVLFGVGVVRLFYNFDNLSLLNPRFSSCTVLLCEFARANNVLKDYQSLKTFLHHPFLYHVLFKASN